MAKYRCRACGKEGSLVHDGRHECPNCGSMDVQFALGIEELPDEFFEALGRLDAGSEEDENEDLPCCCG